ncbi:unnamed protein product [Orchesella dallaii]|uniref:Uncharacterized protein n=1 Tax=Orchesella dallaii TaxID=48710 RepID=A0ABP1PQS3_9HEXA
MKVVIIIVVSLFILIKLASCGQSLTQASVKKSNQSDKPKIQDVMNSYSEASTTKSASKDGNKGTSSRRVRRHSRRLRLRKHNKKKHPSFREEAPEVSTQGREIYQSLEEDTPGIQGRGFLHKIKNSTKTKAQGLFGTLVTPKSQDPEGRAFKKEKTTKGQRITGVSTSSTTTEPPLPKERELPKEPDLLPDNVDCSFVTRNSAWEDQSRIRSCHLTTHDHPRQQARKSWSSDPAYDENDKADFKHLAIFNIKHDLDFQEVGEPCSVDIQSQFMLQENEEGIIGPVQIDLMSFNRVWYKRLCSFFSFLECVPNHQLRKKRKHSSDGSKHVGNDDEHEIIFEDSGMDTTGLLRLKIGGRGPGKARHKSGPGGGRLDHRTFQGMAEMVEDNDYQLDGTCVCSHADPNFPDRERVSYGMNFVEDEARPRWCVAAPGNLCGRVYFRTHTWPGQTFYEFSDHIGCPRKYNGDEYECVRWKKDPSAETNRKEFPNVITSTCEKKPKDPEIERQKSDKKRKSSHYRRKSDGSVLKVDTISALLAIVILAAV